MQKILQIIFCLITIATMELNVSASDKVSYYYDKQWHDYNVLPISLQINGDIMKTEVPPIILNDRTLVPVRSVFEKLGATVSWDESSQKVKVLYDNTSIELTIDSNTAIINGKACNMDIPAKIINNSRTMIPLRFVAEKMGMKVIWNESTRLIDISADKVKTTSAKSNSAQPEVNNKNPNILGIDVSNWQGDISYSDVKSTGIKVVYIKATEGVTYTDPYLNANYQGAKTNGLKVGFYHFLRANDPVEEAKNFLSQVNGYTADCKFMIDVESTYDQTPEQISSNVRKFADYLISQGKEVGIYTYLNFYKNNLNDSIKDLPIWIAEYDVLQPDITCIGWQNTSNGSIKGINTRVDIDYFGNGILLNKSGNLKALTTVSETGTKTVNVSDKLNIRSAPSVSGDIIGELVNGDKVYYNSYIVNANNEIWYSLDYNGQEGFVIANYLKD